MTIFALDSSTTSASVAIVTDGQILFSHTEDYGRTHSERLMPLCDVAFKTAGVTPKEIDLYVVCNGPGSYTGLRIAVSTIKGLAMACNKPCVAVNTLQVLAAGQQDGNVITLLNARRGNFFSAAYRVKDGATQQKIAPTHLSCGEIQGIFEEKHALLAGDGAKIFYEMLVEEDRGRFTLTGNDMPTAEVAARIGLHIYNKSGGILAEDLLPDYIRPVKIG